jgi:transcription elongation factor SPT4
MRGSSSDASDEPGGGTSDYIPAKIRGLRSCIGCGFLQTSEWWKEQGQDCPNCQWSNAHPRITKIAEKCTSASFSGTLSLFQPRKSWCAKWQRYHTNVEGMYALDNEGEVTSDIWEHLERKDRPLPEWVERAKTPQTESK